MFFSAIACIATRSRSRVSYEVSLATRQSLRSQSTNGTVLASKRRYVEPGNVTFKSSGSPLAEEERKFSGWFDHIRS
jgi:hypothetical protein